ncbi:MAG: UDP-2,3-diacylglucosamine diphosphatase [Vibrionaceae bacterium]
MTTLFIADLHLKQSTPHVTAHFLHFLREEASKAQALYILGDLFEFWVGDDEPQPLHAQVADALQALSQHGVQIFFIHGNRDFLVGEQFAKKAGITLLPEHHLVDLYGTATLIMHGDTLCTDDIAYQNYRKKVHNKKLQWIFKHLPLRLRQKIGATIRQRSHEKNHQQPTQIAAVNQQALEAAMQHYQVQHLIHGHTHEGKQYSFDLQGKNAERFVLGDWHTHSSVLVCSEEGWQLVSQPIACA